MQVEVASWGTTSVRWFINGAPFVRGSRSKSTNAPWDSCYLLRSFVTQPALSPTRPTIDPTTNFVLALCSPFLPSSRALSLSISFFLSPSLSLSIFVLLFAEHSLSSLPCSLQSLLFQPHLSISSFLFWQPPLFLLPVLSLPAYSPVSPTRRQSWALLEETPVPAIIEIKSSILVDAAFTHSMFYMFFRLFYTIHPLDLIFFYSIFIFIFFLSEIRK